MSRKYKFHDNDKLYFISFAVINLIDLPAGRQVVFIKDEYNQTMIESWKHCQSNKGLVIYWCIMSNHIHLIISAKGNKVMCLEILKNTPLINPLTQYSLIPEL